MNRRHTPQLTALVLSTFVTLATLGWLDHIAATQGAQAMLARAAQPAAQEVVVVGPRAARS